MSWAEFSLLDVEDICCVYSQKWVNEVMTTTEPICEVCISTLVKT